MLLSHVIQQPSNLLPTEGLLVPDQAGLGGRNTGMAAKPGSSWAVSGSGFLGHRIPPSVCRPRELQIVSDLREMPDWMALWIEDDSAQVKGLWL